MRERGLPVTGRELDLPRDGEVGVIHVGRRRRAEDVHRSRRHVQEDDLVGDRRAAADERDAIPLHVEPRRHRGMRDVEVDQLAGPRVEDREVLDAVALPQAGDPPVVEETVGRHAEDPLGPAELRLDRMQRLQVPLAFPVQVPPPGSVRDEMEVAGRAPRGLEDRLLARPAGDRSDAPEGRVTGEVRDEQLGPVPRHPGQIPFQPAELGTVGRDPRAGVEVATGSDHDGLRGAVGREGHELVRPRPRDRSGSG